MIKIIRTHSQHADFISLVGELNAYLAQIDGKEHDFYNQFNNIDVLGHVVVGYIDDRPVGCGAMKPFGIEGMEVKRMYTKPDYRKHGVASKILDTLEDWAAELGYASCILETGKRQVEAVEFYTKKAYQKIPNYGPYVGIANSLCFKKILPRYEKRQ